MPYPVKLVFALLLTEALEVPVCLLFGLRRKDLLIVLLANLLTNPAVNVLYLLSVLYTPLPRVLVIAVLEVSAIVTEWLIYRSLTEAKHPFWMSLVANAVSYGVGLLLTTVLF